MLISLMEGNWSFKMNRVEYYSKRPQVQERNDANRSGITKCFRYKDVACVIDAKHLC
jgi:GTP cyclohydrolase I